MASPDRSCICIFTFENKPDNYTIVLVRVGDWELWWGPGPKVTKISCRAYEKVSFTDTRPPSKLPVPYSDKPDIIISYFVYWQENYFVSRRKPE